VSAKAYILLDVIDGKSSQVASLLRGRPGVVMAEPLDGPPDVIMVLEAGGRLDLAKLAIQALNTVESYTNDVRCLPVSSAAVVGGKNGQVYWGAYR